MELEDLYAQCPSVPCKQNCDKCCGPTPFSPSEWRRAKRHLKHLKHKTCTFLTQGTIAGTVIPAQVVRDHGEMLYACVFKTPHGCSIYEDRPFTCRVFGTVRGLDFSCPEGRAPLFPLERKKVIKLVGQYRVIVAREVAAEREGRGK